MIHFCGFAKENCLKIKTATASWTRSMSQFFCKSFLYKKYVAVSTYCLYKKYVAPGIGEFKRVDVSGIKKEEVLSFGPRCQYWVELRRKGAASSCTNCGPDFWMRPGIVFNEKILGVLVHCWSEQAPLQGYLAHKKLPPPLGANVGP